MALRVTKDKLIRLELHDTATLAASLPRQSRGLARGLLHKLLTRSVKTALRGPHGRKLDPGVVYESAKLISRVDV